LCDNYYQLGSLDYKLRFPFNLKKRRNLDYSGIISYQERLVHKGQLTQDKRSVVRGLYNKFLFLTGFNHYRSKFCPSHTFIKWVGEFNPDIIYSQLSSLEEIRIVTSLQSVLKIPVVIHIMDDWPSTIRDRYFPKWIWGRIIDRELKRLFCSAKVLLSISEAMSEEYHRRYGLSFTPFHNPIDLQSWMPFRKTEYALSKQNVSVLYSGRIGIGISESLLDVAEAIESINQKGGRPVSLNIQTTSLDHNIVNSLKKYSCVIVNPVVEYEQIPRIFSQADILLLANDFDVKAVRFLRLSMPTKASEYMISGTPILVYSAEETAVTRFFKKNNCGLCVIRRDKDELVNAILKLINETTYRQEIGNNAVQTALERFDAVRVREEFRHIILKAKDTYQ
jgi:glycosyltransferase involved in cell wall biosynthesis